MAQRFGIAQVGRWVSRTARRPGDASMYRTGVPRSSSFRRGISRSHRSDLRDWCSGRQQAPEPLGPSARGVRPVRRPGPTEALELARPRRRLPCMPSCSHFQPSSSHSVERQAQPLARLVQLSPLPGAVSHPCKRPSWRCPPWNNHSGARTSLRAPSASLQAWQREQRPRLCRQSCWRCRPSCSRNAGRPARGLARR